MSTGFKTGIGIIFSKKGLRTGGREARQVLGQAAVQMDLRLHIIFQNSGFNGNCWHVLYMNYE